MWIRTAIGTKQTRNGAVFGFVTKSEYLGIEADFDADVMVAWLEHDGVAAGAELAAVVALHFIPDGIYCRLSTAGIIRVDDLDVLGVPVWRVGLAATWRRPTRHGN